MDATQKKPHVVFIPFPGQSHVKAMLKLAEVLHHKGLQITFVNTDFVHKRFLESSGPHCLDGAPGFRFESIPDGVPNSSEVSISTARELVLRPIQTNFLLAPFIDLLTNLENPPTCIISDGFLSVFTIDAAQKLGIQVMMYWTVAACGFMGIYHIQSLIDKGIAPLKDESYLTNGYLDTVIDWVPGMEGIRLKDFPMVWTTELSDKQLKLASDGPQRTHRVSHHIFHTFDELEPSIIKALSSMYPHVYTIGPLQLLLDQIPEEKKQSSSHGYSFVKEEPECLQWLQSKEPSSVIYVNFGSSTEKVLNHPSVGGFLTHCGWGSVIESLSAGVPMICWPYFWDQMTNCRYICNEWEVGLELGKKVKRDEVKRLVQELMGEGGHKMRNKAIEWKEKAVIATGPNGSSSMNIDKIVKEIMMEDTTN
ncbi:hypothetical protein L1987_66379 [Smallanthus sonchifolius]|uniref:Uncharacterized protein n=1 Tax=Smallanthus sonchifolius TaxID=185202 RepID=A0ACB9BX39_9ASTR|nr:hypothetical protein L1987_66379 [Smallanthus sonchifolius]